MPYNATEYMRPSEIYYTQDSIGVRFTDGNFLSDVYYSIIEGNLNPNEDIPPLTVVYHDGKPFALGCRRLYIYKKLEELDVIRKVIVEISTPQRESHRFQKLLTTQNGGTSIELRGRFRERRAYVYPWEFYKNRYHYENWTKSEKFKAKNRRRARSEAGLRNQHDEQNRAQSASRMNNRQQSVQNTRPAYDQSDQRRSRPVNGKIPETVYDYERPKAYTTPSIPSYNTTPRITSSATGNHTSNATQNAYITESFSSFTDINRIRQDNPPNSGSGAYAKQKKKSKSCPGCTIL
ncbi:unnamed protein product [Owenia fusiformis]|uniref:Uncharacterized protein n=1 Tax=Owenia fusiformis TaxID=6347 RepID=A0A8J1XIH4_OWEFU|nr:unnamed protein product [Owenia fusiformis]